MKRDRDLDKMKQDALIKLREAEKAALAYFTACEPGPERIRASQVYNNIRNAPRVQA